MMSPFGYSDHVCGKKPQAKKVKGGGEEGEKGTRTLQQVSVVGHVGSDPKTRNHLDFWGHFGQIWTETEVREDKGPGTRTRVDKYKGWPPSSKVRLRVGSNPDQARAKSHDKSLKWEREMKDGVLQIWWKGSVCVCVCVCWCACVCVCVWVSKRKGDEVLWTLCLKLRRCGLGSWQVIPRRNLFNGTMGGGEVAAFDKTAPIRSKQEAIDRRTRCWG